MNKTLKLVFARPVGDEVLVNEKDGKFGVTENFNVN